MTDALSQLAERLEQASGPDRDLDALILTAAFGYPVEARQSGDELFYNRIDRMGRVRVPSFTASIDAAMTLVPDGWRLRQMHFNAPSADDRKWNVQLHGGREGEDCFTAFAATRELALCAAALRARKP